MPKAVPNLHFAGQCEAALALYEKALGARRTFMMRYGETDLKALETPLTQAQKAYVYHAEMALYGQRVLLSDDLQGVDSGWIPVSLTVLFETPEQVHGAYALMREGATVIHEMTETAYSAAFVSLRDRYGVRWELMTEA